MTDKSKLDELNVDCRVYKTSACRYVKGWFKVGCVYV